MATPSVDAMSVAGYSVAAPSTSPRLRQGARARKRPPSSASLFSQRGRLMSPSEVSEEPSMLFDCGTGVVWTLHGIREVMREKLMQHTRARSQFRQAITHFFHGQDHVNLQSFTRAFRDMGIPLKAHDAKLLFDKFDVNRTGTVDCREFLQSVFGRDFKRDWEGIGNDAPVPRKKFTIDPPTGAGNLTARYPAERVEALLKLKLEQQYQEGSGQLMHMVGKMYGRVDARNLPCEQFVRTTYAWVGVNLTSEQLQAILTKSASRTSRGGVDVYKLVSYLVRGAPQPHQPVVGLDREWKKGQHHRTKLPKYSSVTEVEDLIKKKAEQRVLANNNPAAKLLRLFHKVDETGNNTVSKAEFKRVLETLGVQLTEADLRALIHRQKEREGVGARSSHGRVPPRRPKQSGPKPAMNTREFCTDTPLNWLPPASDVEVWRDDMRKHRLVTSKVISPGHEMLVSARDRSESRASAVSSRTALSSVVPFRRGAADLMRGDRSVDSRASVRDGREIANRVLRSRTRRRDGRSNQRGPGGDGGSVVGSDAARGDSAIDYYNFVVNTVGQPGCSRRGVAVGQASQRLRAPSVSSRRSEDLSMEDLRRALVVAQRAADALRKRASGAASGAASKGGSQTRGAESVGARVPVPPSTARSARSRSSGRHASQGPATPRDAALTARTIKHAIEILATARAASRSQA